MYKSGICHTKPAISLKRSDLEPKVLYRVSVETPARAIDWRQIRRPRLNVGLLFREKLFYNGYLAHFCRSSTKFGNERLGLANRFLQYRPLYSPNFVNFVRGSRDQEMLSLSPAVISLVHLQSGFSRLPYVCRYPSFGVRSIHCVARRLGTSFLFKCPHRAVVPCDSTAFLFKTKK